MNTAAAYVPVVLLVGMGVVGGGGWGWGGGLVRARWAFLLLWGCRERPINYET